MWCCSRRLCGICTCESVSDEVPVRHCSVLLAEAVDALAVRPGGIYLDATFGGGGHAAAILGRLGPDGRLLALDRDPAAVDAGAEMTLDQRFLLECRPFSQVQHFAREQGVEGQLDGLLFDLGVSSPQLEEPARGFSFMRDGPLDMRMNPQSGESAAEFLARASLEEIVRVLKTYGEERHARRIARALVSARSAAPLTTTGQLVAVIEKVVPRGGSHRHPATQTFQALRIQVNRELEELEQALEQAPALLAPGGRLAVISFHSLEDRLVKRFIRRESGREPLPPGLPLPEGSRPPPRLLPVGRRQMPQAQELAANWRARSAVLRVAERAA